MKIWGMSTEEFAALLDESFTAIKKASRTADAQHYARTRSLASNLENALEKIRDAARTCSTPAEDAVCA